MAEFEKVIGTITVNKNILQVDNQFAGNMFSSDLTYGVNFTDDFWDGFEILEWYAASSVVGETVVCEYDSANKKLKIPYGVYIKNGPLYLSLRGIKDSVKYASNILVLLVGENINIEENDIVNDPSWLDKVQAIIDDVFVSKYDPQYEALVQKVDEATQKANNISETLENKLRGGEFTPEFTIGNVETVEPSVPAEVTQTGTQLDPILNFKIPRGATNVVNDLDGYSEAEAPSQKAVHEEFDKRIVNTFDSENKESTAPTIKAIIDNMTPQDNLLINSDFRYGVINQKGKLSYSASNQMTYTIDMWRIYNGKLSVVNGVDYNGWKYSNNTSTEHALEQLVDLQYDTYTLMVDLTDISGNCRIKLWGENDTLINEKTPVDGINILNGTGVIKKVQLCVANGSFVFKKAKLEEGQYYTGMPPWNGTVDLIKCMRYFQRFDRAPMYTTTLHNPTYFMVAGFFVPMHKKPSMKVTKILNSNKQTQAQSLVSYIVSNYGLVDFTIGANIGQYGYVSCEFDAYDYE